MTAPFVTLLFIALLVFLAMIVIGGRRIFSQPSLLTLFFIVYFADNFLAVLTSRYPGQQLIPGHTWEGFLICNWSGKLYSALFALAFLVLFRRLLTRSDAGLTLRQKPGSLLPALLVTLALAGWAAWVGACSPKGRLDLETLVYLAVMPGLAEELVYRGCLLGLLDQLFPGRLRLCAAPLGWGALLTALLFGLLHGLWLDSVLSLHIDWIALRNAALSGLVFAWLRARTGSLLMPVVAHGAQDLAFFLPRML
jgi:hypothetical protein